MGLRAARVGFLFLGVFLQNNGAAEPTGGGGAFSLKAAAFKPGGLLPPDHRGDEDDVSPALEWAGAPTGTESFVLIADETEGGSDGPPRTMWLVYDIPSSVSELREEISSGGTSDVPRLGMKDDAGQEPIVVDPMEQAMGGMFGGYEDPEMAEMRRMISGVVDASFAEENRAKEGRAHGGRRGYHGPTGRGTALTFKLYALRGRLGLEAGAGRDEVLAAMKGKVLGKASLSARAGPSQ